MTRPTQIPPERPGPDPRPDVPRSPISPSRSVWRLFRAQMCGAGGLPPDRVLRLAAVHPLDEPGPPQGAVVLCVGDVPRLLDPFLERARKASHRERSPE